MNYRVSFVLFLMTFLSCHLSSQISIEEYDESFKKMDKIVEADSLANIWQYNKALYKYQHLQADFLQSEKWTGYIYCLSRIGEMHFNLGHNEISMNSFSKALKIGKEKLGDDHPEVARVYYHLSDYYRAHDKEKYVEACKKALAIRVKKLNKDHLDLADSFMQIGTYYYLQKDFTETITKYQQAVQVYNKHLSPTSLRLGRAYRYYAFILNEFHDSERAFHYLLEARNIYDVHPEARSDDRYHVYNNLANRYFEKDEYDLAIPLYQQTIGIISKSFGPKSADLVTPYGNLGVAYYHVNQDVKAIKSFRKAISIVESFPKEFQSSFGVPHQQYGDFFLARNQADSALYHYNIAVHYETLLPFLNNSQLVLLLSKKAKAFLHKNELDSSAANIQKSLIFLEKSFDNIDFHTNPSITKTLVPDLLYEKLGIKAEVFLKLFEQAGDTSMLIEAISIYNKLDSLADRMRNEIWSEETKLFTQKYYKNDAANALYAITQLDNVTPSYQYDELAFRFMEKNRYSKIFHTQSQILSMSKEASSDSLYKRLLFITSQLDNVKNNLFYELDSLLILQQNISQFKLIQEAELLQSELSVQYPNQINVDYGNMFSLSEVQSKLSPNTQIIEYFWGDKSIFALAASGNESKIFELPLTDSIRRNIASFKGVISRSKGMEAPTSVQSTELELYSQIGYHLYSSLVEPSLISGKEHIIISTDGELTSFPFDALISQPTANSWRTAPYLVKDYNIQYALNFTLLFNRLSPKKISKPSVIAFAYSDHLEEQEEENHFRNTLGSIVGSSRELSAIKQIFKEDRHTYVKGLGATESVFKDRVENFDIVHLALHGKADNKNELNSCLYFRDAQQSQNDGQLFAHELYQFNLKNTRLAVLSACESGIGKEVKGEGVFNMARGFIVAGCATVVMSLWNISDRTTAEIMKMFYQNLKDGDFIHSALRRAKLSYIDNAIVDKLSHPYYWSVFVPIGESSTVVQYKNVTPSWVLISIATLSFLICMVFKRARNGQK